VRCSILFGAVLLAASAGLRAEDWPQFRGPNGDGCSDSRDLPLTWSESENVKWKTPVHGRAWSSPVISGDQVWLTTATEDGRELFVVCVDRGTGTILRDEKVFEVEKPQFCHQFNSYASPTPVIEPGRVYVTFGSPGTACLDSKTGEVLWERRDFVCNHYRGAGSSPILYGNLLIMNFDGSDHQFVTALDKRTGKTLWRTERSIDFKDLGPDGKPFASSRPGTIGGHRGTRIFGRLDCPAALRAIARGGYLRQRVFFLNRAHARAAGYRPCGITSP